MSKLPKLILTVVALTAIFLWVSTAFNSCGTDGLPDDPLLVEAQEAIDDFEDGVDNLSEDIDEDIFASDDETTNIAEPENVPSEEENIFDDPIDTDFTDPEPVVTQAQPSKPNSAPSTTRSASTSQGDYMVIAGNYLVASNANNMIGKLSNLGYPNAEIGVFDGSQYHTVIAARYTDYGRAVDVANSIKSKGIDCYVKKRTY